MLLLLSFLCHSCCTRLRLTWRYESPDFLWFILNIRSDLANFVPNLWFQVTVLCLSMSLYITSYHQWHHIAMTKSNCNLYTLNFSTLLNYRNFKIFITFSWWSVVVTMVNVPFAAHTLALTWLLPKIIVRPAKPQCWHQVTNGSS